MKKRDNNWYVTATDTFLGAKSKKVMVCPDLQTARMWQDKWESFSNTRYVNIRSTKPYYGSHVQCTYYDGANDGKMLYSVNDNIVTDRIAADFKRLGL